VDKVVQGWAALPTATAIVGATTAGLNGGLKSRNDGFLG